MFLSKMLFLNYQFCISLLNKFLNLSLIRPKLYWNGIASPVFVDIVVPKQFPWKLGDVNNARMSCVKEGFILELIR